MIIVMMGAPGAGKGTQSELLQEELGFVHVSSGDLLRDNRKRGTELGKAADQYMSQGQFVPDKLVIDMIVDRLSEPDVEKGILLDGFPRTFPQARALDDALDIRSKRVNAVLFINVERDLLLERLTGRWTCRNCGHVYHEKYAPPSVPGVCDVCGGELYQREDDKADKVETRLHDYFEKTLPIIEYYRSRNVLCEVNGNQEIEKVTHDLLNCLA